jgi:tetratricopeptide (TPR) repeat protein
MNEQQVSLQTILHRRQQQEFVGREKQLTFFQENMVIQPDDDRRRFVFSIYGLGGVGKTTLLRQFFHLTKQQGLLPAWTDEQQENVLEVMVHLARQLDPGHHLFHDFHRRHRAYQQLCRDLETDPQAPKGALAAFVRQTLVKALIHTVDGIPVIGSTIVNILGDDALASQMIEAAKYILRKLQNPEDRRLVQEPIVVLAPLFIAGLNRCARVSPKPRFIGKLLRLMGKKSRPLVILLFFDTFERTSDFLDEWLREILAGHYGEVSPTLLILISGRHALNKDQWIPYWDAVAPLNLEPFTEQETQRYLSHKGITNQGTVDVIQRLSGGLPLLVATLASEHPADPTQVGDPEGTAIDRFLRWITDPPHRSAAVQAALPRFFNRDVVHELVGDQDTSEIFSWLIERPFVYEQENGWRYHDVVRRQMLRRFRRESPLMWAQIHGRLADLYGKDSTMTDPAARRAFVEAHYHRLCHAPHEALRPSLNAFVDAFTIDERFALALAKAIEQAGEECEVEDAAHYGAELTKGLIAYNEKQYPETEKALTFLLDSDLLEDQSRAIAYAWRGLVYLELGQHAQALEDLEASLEMGYEDTTDAQTSVPSLPDISKRLPSDTGILVLMLIVFVLFLLSNRKNIDLSFGSEMRQRENVARDASETTDGQGDSHEGQPFDEETTAWLREYLQRLMKRKNTTQD